MSLQNLLSHQGSTPIVLSSVNSKLRATRAIPLLSARSLFVRVLKNITNISVCLKYFISSWDKPYSTYKATCSLVAHITLIRLGFFDGIKEGITLPRSPTFYLFLYLASKPVFLSKFNFSKYSPFTEKDTIIFRGHLAIFP